MNFSAITAIKTLLAGVFTASGAIVLSLAYTDMTNAKLISSPKDVASIVRSSVGAIAPTSLTPQTAAATRSTPVSQTTTSVPYLTAQQPKRRVPCLALPISNSPSSLNWANFFRFNGIFYNSQHDDLINRPAGRLIANTDLGSEFTKVKCNLNERVRNPNEFESTDGDASYLPTGTPVYRVKGYKPEFRLAAYWNNQLLLFEANQNSQAKKGANLLDIKNKVQYIGINSGGDPKRELAAIKNPQLVASIVDLVLKSPVDQKYREQKERRYLIVFHLKDGTTVDRSYWPDSNELNVGILLPRRFRTAVEQALRD